MSHWQDRLAAYKAGTHPLPPFRQSLSINLADFLKTTEPGHIVYEWPIDPAFHHQGSGVFGGYLAALADDVAALTIMSDLNDDQSFTTDDLHINFFAPVRKGTLRLESQITHRGRSSAFIEISFTLDDGTLAAKAAVTMIVRQQPTTNK